MDFPYVTDYAKSSRAICRGCSTNIVKDTLRIAIMLQSDQFDGMVPNWYHYQCFFIEHMPKSSREIDNFDSLQQKDKEEIENVIRKGESPFASSQNKNNLKREITKSISEASLKYYNIEYTKNGFSKCKHCTQNIKKNEIRICKKINSCKNNSYHFNCFVEIHEKLEFLEAAKDITGFSDLLESDKTMVEQSLPGLCDGPPKKKRLSSEQVPQLSEEELEAKNNNNIMHKYRAELKSNLTKKELAQLLKENGQCVPRGYENMLDRACDMLTYGALGRCINCGGQLTASNIGYKCYGMQNEWTKCTSVTKNPFRTAIIVPEDLRLKHTFLYKYEFIPRNRFIVPVNLDEISAGPLRYKNFLLSGFDKETTDLYNKVKQLGGQVMSEVRRSIFAVITTKEQVDLRTDVIKLAEEYEVYVVDKDFLKSVYEEKDVCLDDIARKHSLCSWGTELHNRKPKEFKNAGNQSSCSSLENEETGKRRMKVKGGIAIEPETGLENEAHVYQSGDVRFNAVLSRTDISSNLNSYYKIQLLESDDYQRYWIFKSWGRTGTKCGSCKLEKMWNLKDAKNAFKLCFKEKTGNKWENRHNLVKRPYLYTFIDVNYEATKEEIDLNIRVADSHLKPAVAQLVATIFNVQAIEKLMLEYELDLQRMPLGKLSRAQIIKAYQVLTELSWIAQRQFTNEIVQEYTNKFYSFMPHSSALRQLPLLNTKEAIQKKSEMLANLLEMETAYNIIQRGANNEGGNPLDAYYKHLKADIDVLEENTDEYKLISEYLMNTHGETHHFQLKILEAFRVTREEEPDRFDSFKKLHNRRLLWHGSRTTNYAGILSQGLRIAPPEAPRTGYMFGKGIYFADMVSKSANYCCVTNTNTEGLLLLCEVALGNMLDRTNEDNIKRLPSGFHSVRGIGRTCPDPTNMKILEDGLQVPLGKPQINDQIQSSLLYNEYIVYNVAQVHIKYLLKVDFKYNN